MSIVTKTGDKGETSLMYGHRVSKSDPRVDAYGCVDELTAALGLARSVSTDKFVSDEIFAVQKDLIVVMGELATAPSDRERYVKDGFQLTTSAMVDRVTALIVDLEKDESLYPKDWVIRCLLLSILLAQPAGAPSGTSLRLALTNRILTSRYCAT